MLCVATLNRRLPQCFHPRCPRLLPWPVPWLRSPATMRCGSHPSLPQGVWEKDEVRKDDSFRSFEEVFEIAARNDADLVLLGEQMQFATLVQPCSSCRPLHL